MNPILVINAGSSSIKFQLIDPEREARLAGGLIERIGEPVGRVLLRFEEAGGAGELEYETSIGDHSEGFAQLSRAFTKLGRPLESLGVIAVGHRVVQGGHEFVRPTLIDDEVAARILALSELAPLHNPGHHSAILAARTVLPDAPHVAIFDTAFHQSMPQAAYTYALDRETSERYGVRRYGFHGISHQVVSQRAAHVLGRPVRELKQIVLHLGNGASACAIDRGRSIDTSMGLTPLEGLVMGTRTGDIDPGALLHMLRGGLSLDELDTVLNKKSGVLGLAGSVDMRDVRAAAEAGDAAARLALDVYVRRVRHYLGAYLVQLGGADAIVFTAGVGENQPAVRAEVCEGLEWFGIEVDAALNEAPSRDARVISTAASRVAVLVVPTDEEAEIAKQTALLVGR